MFTTATGVPITRRMVQQSWRKATDALGLEPFHVHDVRHLGPTLAAQSGATITEVMQRAGHSTARAALLYQHAAEDRRQVVADGLGDRISAGFEGSNGPRLARRPAAGD